MLAAASMKILTTTAKLKTWFSQILGGPSSLRPRVGTINPAQFPFFRVDFVSDLSLSFIFEITLLHAADDIWNSQWACWKWIAKKNTTLFLTGVAYSSGPGNIFFYICWDIKLLTVKGSNPLAISDLNKHNFLTWLNVNIYTVTSPFLREVEQDQNESASTEKPIRKLWSVSFT